MSKIQMALLSFLAVVLWAGIPVFGPHSSAAFSVIRMPADGSALPLPPPIEVAPGVIRQ